MSNQKTHLQKLQEKTKKENSRKMDATTFKELLDAGEIGLILMDGGTNLTKQQLEQVKKKAKEQSEEKMLKKQMAQAKQPGYAESQLIPQQKKVLENSFSNKSEEPATPPVNSPVTPNIEEKKPVQKITQDNKPSISTKLKDFVASKVSMFKTKQKTKSFGSAEEALGEIFKLMVKMEKDKKLEREESANHEEERNDEEEKRNKELIKALTGRKKPKPRKRKEKAEKKPEEKKAEKKEEPAKAEPTKKVEAPAPKAEAPKKTEVPKKAEAPAPKAEAPKKAEAPAPKPEAPKPTTETKPSIIPQVAKAGIGAVAITGLGSASAKFESNGNPGTVSSGMMAGGKPDPGGISYGTYQMASKYKVPDKFISESKWKDEFKGLQSGTPEFGEKWKEIAARDKKDFADAQHDYIKKTHFDPAAAEAKKMGFDLNDAGVADAIWSMSVQHGGYKKVLELSKKYMNGKVNPNPKIQIKALYDARKEYTNGQFDKRYNAEVDVVLAKAGKGPMQAEPTTIGTQLASASQENQNLNMQADMSANKSKTTVNNTQVNVATSTQKPHQEEFDDRPAILRKA